MSPITLSSVLRPKPSVSARRLDDELVLLDLETGNYFGLNPVGTEIWERLAQGIALEAIVAQLVETFEVSRADCERDALELAESLLRQGLLSVEEPPAAPR